MKKVKKKFLKTILFGSLIILLVVSWLAFGDRGFIYLYKKDEERQEYLEKIKNLKIANQKLKDEIERLQSDREYIEEPARKEFDLVKKNEVIYKFVEDDK